MNARSLRRRGLTLLRVRARPGHKTRGVLVAGPLAVPVVLGRGGVRANKFEGDGATPRGRFRLRPPVVAGGPASAAADLAARPTHHP